MTQAVRLRGYLAHMLVTSAAAVDAWTLPPGLLEPFPAELLLTGVRVGGDTVAHRVSCSYPGVPDSAAASHALTTCVNTQKHNTTLRSTQLCLQA